MNADVTSSCAVVRLHLQNAYKKCWLLARSGARGCCLQSHLLAPSSTALQTLVFIHTIITE